MMKYIFILLGVLTLGIICYFSLKRKQSMVKYTVSDRSLAQATFAGGCFWCMEQPFEKLDGVHEVISGYMGGAGENPTYKDYAKKGHVEVVQIFYDPEKVSYEMLLDQYWRNINPTDAGGQFGDRGPQYRSVIFYHNDEQRQLAEKSKQALANSGKFSEPVVTEILPAGTFYPAEEYHQDYATKNPIRYKTFRFFSGRDAFLKKFWPENEQAQVSSHKPSKEELKKRLTPLQYNITQENGTEPAYVNEYWDNKQPGIYVDIVSGEPLFSSLDKYDSKTGWPSFTRPLEPENIVEKQDWKTLWFRTEVRSKQGDSHLGHVFKGGPPPTGLRYCINSAALRFIPVEDLEKEGYKQYEGLFAS